MDGFYACKLILAVSCQVKLLSCIILFHGLIQSQDSHTVGFFKHTEMLSVSVHSLVPLHKCPLGCVEAGLLFYYIWREAFFFFKSKLNSYKHRMLNMHNNMDKMADNYLLRYIQYRDPPCAFPLTIEKQNNFV